MNMLKFAVTAFVAGTVSFSALAAEEVTKAEVSRQHLEKIGTVTTTSKATAPIDAKAELSRLADEKGGRYFRVIAGREHGRISATAEVYK
ncbi:DUF1471 domain-containing protein [Tatumella terrea]|mgnify:CR=1 FL=1|uniref:DUF1471 domain-containing protein n=1 Tax=Tatumella terrea TaxID=419007 RepID=A0ABW1VW94_9GAMM|nr:DUF1471 domain-containing protein [Tatumella sp. JGM118]MBS0909332.1 DUF1471 domain-containing protein [Tatumella sp. JGM118]